MRTPEVVLEIGDRFTFRKRPRGSWGLHSTDRTQFAVVTKVTPKTYQAKTYSGLPAFYRVRRNDPSIQKIS